MTDASPSPAPPPARDRMPRWVPRAIALFWLGLAALVTLRWSLERLRGLLLLLLVSLFLALAIEPLVNWLSARGWRRGRATLLVLLAVLLATGVFLGAIGTLVGTQLADLLQNTEQYVNRIVDFSNDSFGTKLDAQEINRQINDENGGFQRFIASQRDDALRLSFTALNGLLQVFSVTLFTFYLVADGPKLRRAVCSRLSAERQVGVLRAWELAIEKTGGFLYSRALLAGLSAFFHWIAFTAIGVQAPVALAIWVGIISQFIPVVGTYIAGVLPVFVTLLDPESSPIRALAVAIVILVYQQVENYLFAPRVTARTMELHAAIAFGSALAGAAVLGPIGAVLALPLAAMIQAVASEYGQRHEIIDSPLVMIEVPPARRRPIRRLRRSSGGGEEP